MRNVIHSFKLGMLLMLGGGHLVLFAAPQKVRIRLYQLERNWRGASTGRVRPVEGHLKLAVCGFEEELVLARRYYPAGSPEKPWGGYQIRSQCKPLDPSLARQKTCGPGMSYVFHQSQGGYTAGVFKYAKVKGGTFVCAPYRWRPGPGPVRLYAKMMPKWRFHVRHWRHQRFAKEKAEFIQWVVSDPLTERHIRYPFLSDRYPQDASLCDLKRSLMGREKKSLAETKRILTDVFGRQALVPSDLECPLFLLPSP